MKRSVLFLLCICAIASVAQKAPNIAVAPFVGDKSVTQEQLAFITGKFAGELMNTHAFTVLERGKMDYILSEQGFQQGGTCNTSECQVQMGQLLGVDFIVSGNLVRFGRKYAFRADYIDVGSGKVSYFVEQSETGELEDVYERLCQGAAVQLARKAKGEEVSSAVSDVSIASAGKDQSLPQVPADAIPVGASKPLSTKRKVALALWGSSLLGAGFGVYSNTQLSGFQEDYKSAVAAADYNGAASAYTDGNSAETRRTVGYGVSMGTLVLGAILWFWPEEK